MSNLINVLVLEPGKSFNQKSIQGNMKGIQEELNTEYIKAYQAFEIASSEEIILLHDYDKEPIQKGILEHKTIVLKVSEDGHYLSLENEDILTIIAYCFEAHKEIQELKKKNKELSHD